MQKNLRYLAGAAVAAAFALTASSCAYDPYYSSSSVGGSYSSGYGDGYGYGSNSFSTSFFISTGDDRWGYDPHTYAYYDYRRRAYYDPYLNGYYPVGYRPHVVYGAPHPYGWRPGRGHIRPPSRIYDTRIPNYRDRENAYRNSRYNWAKQVRNRPVNQGRVVDSRPSRSPNERPGSNTSGSRYDSRNRPQSGRVEENSGKYRPADSRKSNSRQPTFQRPPTQQQGQGRLPSNYNTPVTMPGRYVPTTRQPAPDNRYTAPRSTQPSQPSRYSNPSRSPQQPPRQAAPSRSPQQPRYSAPANSQQPRSSSPSRSSRSESSGRSQRTEESRGRSNR